MDCEVSAELVCGAQPRCGPGAGRLLSDFVLGFGLPGLSDFGVAKRRAQTIPTFPKLFWLDGIDRCLGQCVVPDGRYTAVRDKALDRVCVQKRSAGNRATRVARRQGSNPLPQPGLLSSRRRVVGARGRVAGHSETLCYFRPSQLAKQDGLPKNNRTFLSAPLLARSLPPS